MTISRRRMERGASAGRRPSRSNANATDHFVGSAWSIVEKRRSASTTSSFSISRSCSRQPERSEEHTSELQSRVDLVCRLLLEKKKKMNNENKVKKIMMNGERHKLCKK